MFTLSVFSAKIQSDPRYSILFQNSFSKNLVKNINITLTYLEITLVWTQKLLFLE